MNNTYELTYIIAAEAGENNISSIQSRVDDILVESKAVKKNIENDYTYPQKKKLNYEIGKSQFGYYITTYFESSAEAIENISKILKLDEDILRFLIISVKGDIPQGVVISKKEAQQQIDDVIDEINIQKEAAELPQAKKTEELEKKEYILEQKDEEAAESDKPEEKSLEEIKPVSAKSFLSRQGSSGQASAAKKEQKKANIEDLDKKLDEILS